MVIFRCHWMARRARCNLDVNLGVPTHLGLTEPFLGILGQTQFLTIKLSLHYIIQTAQQLPRYYQLGKQWKYYQIYRFPLKDKVRLRTALNLQFSFLSLSSTRIAGMLHQPSSPGCIDKPSSTMSTSSPGIIFNAYSEVTAITMRGRNSLKATVMADGFSPAFSVFSGKTQVSPTVLPDPHSPSHSGRGG